MVEYGIWSDAADGFISAGLTEAEAPGELDRLVADDGEDRDDLEVLRVCPEPGHEEEPADGCAECEAEAEDEDEDTEEEDE
jgi:hypothetical protein